MLPSDRILQHHYRAKNYQNYSYRIHDVFQAEKHDEVTMRNRRQRHVGSAPLSKVQYNLKVLTPEFYRASGSGPWVPRR
jgi:hypothetical protein